jgi:serine/threonine protein kinase
MQLAAGSRLDSYDIIAPLGAGGMGEVYRARDAALKREVAIKVLPEVWSRDPERLHRFELEAQSTAALNRGMATIRYKMGHLLNAMVPAIGFREEGLREPGHFQSEPSPKLLHRRSYDRSAPDQIGILQFRFNEQRGKCVSSACLGRNAPERGRSTRAC